jgi:hypothetical protein
VVFEISPSENFSPPPRTLTTTTRSYPQLCDVSALALLSPKTSRFVGLTTYRCRVRFRGPTVEYSLYYYIRYISKPRIGLYISNAALKALLLKILGNYKVRIRDSCVKGKL